MTRKRFGCVGVLDKSGALIGVVTDGDLSRHMSDDVLAQPVTELMTRDPVSTRPEALAMEVLGDMSARKIGAVFVMEDGKPVGILHLHDVLRAGIVLSAAECEAEPWSPLKNRRNRDASAK